MVRLVILGSSCLVATEQQQPTHLAFLGRDYGLLVDCGVSPRGRMENLGIGRDDIDDIFITHFHPDHAAGLPLYLMELWLRGRKKPLTVHAGKVCLQRIKKVFELYEWHKAPDLYRVAFRSAGRGEKFLVIENGDFRVLSSPVRHLVPTLGVRVECLESGRSAVFSSDTEPVPSLVSLAAGADILIHEATGEGVGHSSAAQAAEAARQAGVRKLILIHYDPYADPAALRISAQSVFGGEVALAVDRMEISL